MPLICCSCCCFWFSPLDGCLTALCRLLGLVHSMDGPAGEVWRPAVLPPGPPREQHSVLQGFRDGTCNLLIARAGLPCKLDSIACTTTVRYLYGWLPFFVVAAGGVACFVSLLWLPLLTLASPTPTGFLHG